MSLIVFFHSRDGTPRLSPTSTSDSTSCSLQYLNEGGANLVFRIVDTGQGLPAHLHGKLLRLRKDLPHVQSAEQQLQALDENFSSLFPSQNLIQHELIGLDEGLADALNTALQNLDRHDHRSLDFLPSNERYGLLITDMTPEPDETLLQLKPKWLVQSPNAPQDSKRCRTCALRAQRAAKGKQTATDQQETCPLRLISDSEATRKQEAANVSNDSKIAAFLATEAQPLFRTLRQKQCDLDSQGVLDTSAKDQVHNLCRAMTLRDCTLFVKRMGDCVECRLGDLDLKLPERLERWKSTERSLINDGWYCNTESEAHWREEAICLLAR